MRLRQIPLLLILSSILAFSSCESMKRFLAQDLEEEDFIIGQLYEDEYYKETPYVPPTPSNAPSTQKPSKAGSAFDHARKGGKDMRLYDAAQPWMGTPYKYGGTTKSGVDCSAFVGAVYRDAYHINLPRVAHDIDQACNHISKKELREGDLIFFVNSKKKVSHVGIYLHDGLFVHSSTSNGVSISTLDNSYWKAHFYRGGRMKR